MIELETNPIRLARLDHHKTLHDLASLCQVNYQTLYLNECGVFPSVLPKIKDYLVRFYEQDSDKLDKDYRRFVLDKRRVFALMYADRLESLPDPDLTVHPFTQFRQYIDDDFYSRTKFAKTICIEPAGLYRLERKPLPELPIRIREALLQVGLSSSNLEELCERINEFYTRY